VPSTVYYTVSRMVQGFRQAFPRIRVKVMDAGANDVLAAVVRSEADFGLNFIGNQEPGVDFQPLAENCFVLACRRDHPQARRRRVAWAELVAQEVVAVSQSSGNRLPVDQALAAHNLQIASVCEAQHVTGQLGLVEAGLGVAAVLAMAMPGRDHPVLASVPLDTPVMTRRVGLVRRSGRTLAPAAQALFDAFIAEARAKGRRV